MVHAKFGSSLLFLDTVLGLVSHFTVLARDFDVTNTGVTKMTKTAKTRPRTSSVRCHPQRCSTAAAIRVQYIRVIQQSH